MFRNLAIVFSIALFTLQAYSIGLWFRESESPYGQPDYILCIWTSACCLLWWAMVGMVGRELQAQSLEDMDHEA
jgi:hypothetical protein